MPTSAFVVVVTFSVTLIILSHTVSCIQIPAHQEVWGTAGVKPTTFSVFECEEGGLQLESLKESIYAPWWIELGHKLVAPIVHEVADISPSKGCKCVASYSPSFYVTILQKDHKQHAAKTLLDILPNNNVQLAASGWGFYVVLSSTPFEFEAVLSGQQQGWRIIPLETHQNITLIRSHAVTTPVVNGESRNEVIDELVAHVDGARWFSALTQLTTYNRYTRGTGIIAAQAWITSQLQEIAKTNPNLTIATQAFPVGSTTAYNIIATLHGYKDPDSWVIIGGHYDSTSQSPTSSAPGAEDNASGAAAVLEMLRAFATKQPPSTAIFIFFSGEEQGLYGSEYHASQIVREGATAKVKLMHNMDMIAYKAANNPDYNVLIETNKPYDSFFPSYTTSATTYTSLKLLYSTYAFGSDHEPYLQRGMPGVLTIDGDWDSYPDYHRTTDTPSKCNQQLGFQIIRMGVATIASTLGY